MIDLQCNAFTFANVCLRLKMAFLIMSNTASSPHGDVAVLG